MPMPNWLQRFFDWQAGHGEGMVCIVNDAREQEAAVWRDALAMEGIQVEFRGSDAGVPGWSSFGRCSLWVRESQAERARRIIEHGRGETERRRPQHK